MAWVFFVLGALIVLVIAFYAVARSRESRLAVVTTASFVFYAWWDPRFVPLLGGSILFTWMMVRLHERSLHQWTDLRRRI